MGILIGGYTKARGQSVDTLVTHIKKLQATVQNRRLNISEMTAGAVHLTPVGILGKGGGQGKPPILIDDVVLYPNYAEFRAYAAVLLPGAKEPLYFATVKPVQLSYSGGILGTARIDLVSDTKVNMMGKEAELTVLKGKSYLEFDCKGFKRAGLGVSVNMPKKLVPEDANGNQLPDQRVKGYFAVEFSDLNDILASISIDPFQVRGSKGITITVTDAIIDLSDTNNAANMAFPKDYEKDYLNGVDPALWRGFYIRNFSVKLPEEIKDRSKSGRREFQAKNVLIDSHGFSGEVIAKNLISLENGDLGGWNYSIDSVYVNFRANQLIGAGLAGGLNIPISGDTKKLAYKAIFKPGEEYLFNVATAEDMSFDIFKAANVKISKGSFIEVALREKKFEALANLSGSLSIGVNLSGDKDDKKDGNKFSTGSIGFEQLVISTKAPFIHSGTFSLDVTVNIGTFKASISKLKIIKKNDNRGLGFDLMIGLLNEKDSKNGFSADASLMILGKVEVGEDERQRYKYLKTEFNRVHIKVDQGTFHLEGELNYFKEQPVFGSGFRGSLTAGLTVGSFKIDLSATTLFGNTGKTKYWYADAVAEFQPGITIAAPMEIYGFAGGLYYGVKQKPGDGGPLAIVNSQTGLAYLPDENAGLGVRAAVMFGLVKKKDVFNGNVGFEIAFNRGGGLSRAMLMGNANFLQPMSLEVTATLKVGSMEFSKTGTVGGPLELANKTSAFDAINKRGQLSASIFIDYDVDNSSLFASFKVYVNLYAGAIKGVNAGGLAGEAALYFAPHTWYVHLGTPSQPIGLEILWLAKTKSYFMVGKDLPGSPPPPANVSEILGGKDMDYMRDLNALKSGLGIAFGSSLGFDTGNLQFLIFYARFAAGAGFDVMLKDYGRSAHCEGESGPIGIGGWYANGQVYAFVQGKIGIRIRLFRRMRTFDIIDIGVAAALQAKLPNPTWIHGAVGGYYRLLGGLIKGRCKFEFTVGKECKIVGASPFADANIQVIADVSPKNTDKDVDVFAVPQAVFNMAIGKSFNIEGNGLFRARMEKFTVTSGGAELAGKESWNDDRTVIAYTTDEVLPPLKEVTVSVRVSFEENKGGAWVPFLNDGVPYVEVRNNTFTTGTAPDNIPLSNVAYSYPLINQLNYYQNEAKEGYIKLLRGQSYLFDNTGDYQQTGRVIPEEGKTADFEVNYANKQINYALPKLSNNKGYEFGIVAVPKNTDNSVDRNVKSDDQSVVSEGESDLTVSTKKIEGTLSNAEERNIYSMNFRTSIYDTFSEKIDRGTNVYSFTWALSNGVHEMGYVFNTKEQFDDYEMNDEQPNNLIKMEADLTGNSWYDTHIRPLLYDNSLDITWRNPEKLGLPPLKAMYLRNENLITGLKYVAGQSATPGKVALIYNLPLYISGDYYQTQSNIVNAYAMGRTLNISEMMRTIVTTPFTPVRKGPYAFKVSYVLPGINKTTTVKQLVINNKIGQ
ncbi:hypothetical protein DHW03_02225 [Pedobacter yonginense]|uniref:Uncharacterized protein n=1 Tax=Pedobacter yonginense TaxID=651869 RepID=A0A317EQM6_9SPHI|nr:hypothetical protein DHW03_02225 [Pedobacter yonginense]